MRKYSLHEHIEMNSLEITSQVIPLLFFREMNIFRVTAFLEYFPDKIAISPEIVIQFLRNFQNICERDKY